PDPVKPGELITYTYKVTNHGTDPLSLVQLSTLVPDHTSAVGTSGGSCCDLLPSPAGTNVSWSFNTILPGESLTVGMMVQVDSGPNAPSNGTLISNSAQARDGSGHGDDAGTVGRVCAAGGPGCDHVGSDTSKPTNVQVSAPTSGQTISGTFTLKATAQDNSSTIQKMEFYVDSDSSPACMDTTPKPSGSTFQCNWDTTTKANGSHEVKAKAHDPSGNSALSSAISFTINNVVPTFFTLTVVKAGSGDGPVTGTGINCGSTCQASFNSGDSVTLNATADPGSTLTEWTGCDSVVASCTVTMNSNRTVTAKFSKTIWTDDPIIPHATPVRAVHITELCQAINTLRSQSGVGSFSCPSLIAGAAIQAAHITGLRAALDAVYLAKTGKPATYPTDPGTDRSALVGKEIKTAHIREIRNAVRGVE
ncbi:MAG: Ig-like domain-containing protein, partial [Deltaproteobacteria bacterium]|nr:Ig-like domain-containing protein [Deltaproteobacteria bacterium]